MGKECLQILKDATIWPSFASTKKRLTMNRKITITTLFLVLLSMASCHDEKEPGNTYEPIVLDEKAAGIVNGNNNFGIGLFNLLATDEENFFISPLSVSQALGMTYNGALGETAQQMAGVLGYSGGSADEINVSSCDIRKALVNADNTVTFAVANSIWMSDEFTANPEFVSTNKNYFDAAAQALDFSKKEESMRTINNWVNDQTKGKITEIISGIEPDDMLFLINAIYFKGTWQYEFDKTATALRPFYNNGTVAKEVETMCQQTDLGYFTNDVLSIVELPYGNGHFSMVVFLPNEGKSLDDIAPVLTSENIAGWVNGMQKTAVKLYLPKFKMEYKKTLNQALATLGMPRAFTDSAEFPKMGLPANLLITEVIHKTYIEVDEEGSAAAAVTSVGVGVTSIGPTEPSYTEFAVDRPFVFVIREKDTGALVFMGQIKVL